MNEENSTTPAAKQLGWFRSAYGLAIAALGGLITLMGLLVGFLKGFDDLAAAAKHTFDGLGRTASVASSTPSAPAPQQPPQPTPSVGGAPAQTPVAERAERTLFIAPPPGSDGALIGTRARRVLEQEGFALAGDRSTAGLAIEIEAPVFGPARTLPSSGLTITSVAATLQARIIPGTGGAPAAPPQQREVVGRGDGEEAARRDALSRAADQLGERIATALRQNAASNGPER